MKLTNFLQDVGRPVAYYPRLTGFLGSVKATLFLCQFLFWEGKQRNKTYRWIYKTQNEIQHETGLSRKEQENARRQLKEKGYLEEKYEGIPRRLFFRMQLEAINRDWDRWITDEAMVSASGTGMSESDEAYRT